MPLSLKLALLDQAVPHQLQYLVHTLDSLTPAGEDLAVDDELLAATRRVFADLRRLLAGTMLQLPDPVASVTRRQLRIELRHALSHYVLFAEEQENPIVARRREARNAERLR
jgi:hypothetical protein